MGGKKKRPRLSGAERRVIESMLSSGSSMREIARRLGRSPSTISYEVGRGSVEQIMPDGERTRTYYASYAQRRSARAARHGGSHKIPDGSSQLDELARLIKSGYSPYAAIEKGLADGSVMTRICTKTAYNYIHSGRIAVASPDLPQGFGKRRSKTPFAERRKLDAPGHVSIEERPKSVLRREEFGHWEGDTVVSCRPSKRAILTLVERRTRFLLAQLLPDKKADTVAAALDRVEAMFADVEPSSLFKTLTLDNGTEFSDTAAIQASLRDGRQRIGAVYYAHPFCSSERGTNECIHRFIRRRWPKKHNFDDIRESELSDYVRWVNEYPRKLFGGKSAADEFLPLLGTCPRAA